jgi:hypothetical protein
MMPDSSCFAYDGLVTEVSSLSRKGYMHRLSAQLFISAVADFFLPDSDVPALQKDV